MPKIQACIKGVAGYLPDYVMTNAELSQLVDTSDEWIMSRIGIRERRILKGEGLGSSEMGIRAIERLLEKTGTRPEEVDLLLCATVTPDMQFPATANILADKAGILNAFGYDINAGCSSFLYAMVTASKFIESGSYRKAIVVGTDKMSSITDFTDRQTCAIFGDGAGAVLMEPDTEGFGLIDAKLQVDGAGHKYLHQVAGGSCYPASAETVAKRQHYIFQDGQPVFKAAVSNMADTAVEVMERNGLSGETVDWLVPHQANLRIIDATGKRMQLAKEKVMITIDHTGNTTSATLPLCLAEYEGKLKRGDNLIFATFGAGFTWGAAYLKWAYDGAGVACGACGCGTE
ncbi:MAG: 3-oxoacyl-ACP synthase [Bacteroidia bacterium]|nr:MAG: 3-oxoacyl-ACP synthase [Bacteroidia bacterium]